MTSLSKIQKMHLRQQIVLVEAPFPKDNIIKTYRDFLGVRDVLHFYKFNPEVLRSLVELTLTLWRSEIRINRMSLLDAIQRYCITYRHEFQKKRSYVTINPSPDHLPEKVRYLLFDLFVMINEYPKFISEKQLKEALNIGNRIIKDLSFRQPQEKWLISKAFESEHIMNRVLRYPAKSKTISSWAKNNMNNDELRSRRAELLSRILDFDPHFEVNYKTLTEDFDYFEKHDMELISEYEALWVYYHDKVGQKNKFNFIPDQKMIEIILQTPLRFIRRPYGFPANTKAQYPIVIPDLVQMRSDFMSKIDLNKKFIMIWAVGYSRMSQHEKTESLKKYYCLETYESVYKVCVKNHNTEMLNWMLSNAKS